MKDEPGLLWEGEVRFKTEEKSEEIRAPVQLFHKDDTKNGCKLFDWAPHGHSTIEVIKYPMAVLGGKSRPTLKNLKPFIKDSQLVQLVCKDSNQQESVVQGLKSAR